MTPSTPAPTDPGALADWIDETRREAEKRGDKEQANLLWRTGNVISHGSHTTYPSRDIAQSVRDVVRDLAAALLALLSPSGPMVPWELDCQHKICAAPECECPAVSSTGQVWQPADTAPQDGSTIEVRFLTDNPRRVRWSQSDRGTYWHLADSNGPAIINFNPTEWRPVSSNHPREVGK